MKSLFFFLIIMAGLLFNVYSQNEFRNKLQPLLDTMQQPAVFTDENTCSLTVCEGVDCAKIMIYYLPSADERYNSVMVATPLLIQESGDNISAALLKKINNLNINCKYGKVVLMKEANQSVVFYSGDLWLADLTVNDLEKNLYLCLYYSVNYKKELEMYNY